MSFVKIVWRKLTLQQHCPVPTISEVFNSLQPSDTIWRHGSVLKQAEVTTCYLMVPSHYLNQCWLLISEIPWNSPKNNSTVNAQTIILCNEFEKLLPHLPRVNELNTLSSHLPFHGHSTEMVGQDSSTQTAIANICQHCTGSVKRQRLKPIMEQETEYLGTIMESKTIFAINYEIKDRPFTTNFSKSKIKVRQYENI